MEIPTEKSLPVKPPPRDIDARWGYLVLGLLLLPTLILVFKDRHVWYYDEALYGFFSASLFQILVHSPLSWPGAMVHAVSDRAPAIAWLGQFFVPLGYKLPLFQSALLLFIWMTQAASVTMLYLALRRMFQNTLPALLASAIVATGPLFTGLTVYYLVEPLQLLSIVWLFALTAYRERMSHLVLFLQATAAIAFGLLVKTSTPLFAFPVLLFLVYVSLARESRFATHFQTGRRSYYMSLASALLALLMVLGAIGWYAINYQAAIRHVMEASSGTFALYYGSKGDLLTKLPFWLKQFQGSYFYLPLLIATALMVPRAIVVRLRRAGRLNCVDLLGLISIVWIAAILLLFSCNINESSRYLLGLAPYVAFALCWLAAHLQSRTMLFVLGIGCIGQSFVVTACDYGLIAPQKYLSEYVQPYVRDEQPLRDSMFCARNTADSSPEHATMVGTELMDFNPEGVEFYHAILLGQNGGAPSYRGALSYRCYQRLNVFQTDPEVEWRRVRESGCRYYVYRKHDPAQDSEAFNQLSTPILARIAADSEFRFRPDKSNERVFVFERGHGGPGFTGMPGVVGGFQNVNPEYSLPFGYLDSPRIGESVEGGVPLAVSGWAVAPSGIAAIVIQLDGRRVADATSTNRPDIERAFPKLRSTGYWASLSTSSLSAGRHEITVVAYARDGTLRILARVPVALRVPGFQGLKPEGSLPFGLLESPKIGDSVEGGPPLLVWGRAVAPSGITTVEIQLDGRRVGSLPARSLPAGPHEISVLAHARDGASRVLARIPINTFATQPK